MATEPQATPVISWDRLWSGIGRQPQRIRLHGVVMLLNAATHGGGPMTPREVQVLRLVAYRRPVRQCIEIRYNAAQHAFNADLFLIHDSTRTATCIRRESVSYLKVFSSTSDNRGLLRLLLRLVTPEMARMMYDAG